MKITFFSNFLNHHQLPFCLEMIKSGVDFKFVATEPVPEERLQLGYDDMNIKYDFVVRAYENEDEAFRLGLNSDIVIIGSADKKYIKERLKEKRLTFRYSERIYKNGFNLRTWLAVIKNYAFSERNVYLLCASAYTAYDYNLSFAYKNKTIKWGYFPEIYHIDINDVIKRKQNNKKIEILWVGRFLDWKHPEKAVLIAKKLKEDNYDFSLKMIGIGDQFDSIKKMINDYNLNDCVKLIGSVNNKEVRKYMEEANIYLFTSDYGEGWGAVLNEAMNSGCAIVASQAIGSVPFLIKNNYNGFIYDNDDINDLYDKVKILINDKKLACSFGKRAYETVFKIWNAKNAAKRFLNLVKKIEKKKTITEEDGPCSIAMPISNKKMYQYLMRNKYDKKNN